MIASPLVLEEDKDELRLTAISLGSASMHVPVIFARQKAFVAEVGEHCIDYSSSLRQSLQFAGKLPWLVEVAKAARRSTISAVRSAEAGSQPSQHATGRQVGVKPYNTVSPEEVAAKVNASGRAPPKRVFTRGRGERVSYAPTQLCSAAGAQKAIGRGLRRSRSWRGIRRLADWHVDWPGAQRRFGSPSALPWKPATLFPPSLLLSRNPLRAARVQPFVALAFRLKKQNKNCVPPPRPFLIGLFYSGVLCESLPTLPPLPIWRILIHTALFRFLSPVLLCVSGNLLYLLSFICL
ncbi:hypothetical protein MRX96_055761 [Rhipicephalus microplus]